jgi:ribosomal protein S18 acetylase RimI-like enzyme
MSRQRRPRPVVVRNTRPEDFEEIIRLTELVYPGLKPWTAGQLQSHLAVFPEGQLVAVDPDTGRIVGMAASLRLRWDDYPADATYRDHTGQFCFTNHDPEGETLYGAEVMVDPTMRRRRIGSKLYEARRQLARQVCAARIMAGARLAGYAKHAGRLSAEEYAAKVATGELADPTVSFQLRNGFRIVGVSHNYFRHDPQSQEYAAIIEWTVPQDDAMAGRCLRASPPRRAARARRADTARPSARPRRSSPDPG